MLVYDLQDIVGDSLIYSYQVEGREQDVGSISIDTSSGVTEVVDLAPNDDFRWYAHHLMRRLEGMYADNDFKDHGLVMWY